MDFSYQKYILILTIASSKSIAKPEKLFENFSTVRFILPQTDHNFHLQIIPPFFEKYFKFAVNVFGKLNISLDSDLNFQGDLNFRDDHTLK